MKKLIFNDSRQIEVQSASAAAGVFKVRMINTTIDTLEALFSNTFATSKMSLVENGKITATFENFTSFQSVKKECGGIYEVETRQTEADTATRLAAVEDAVKAATKGDAELFNEFIEAQAQTLSDEQALNFVKFAPEWKLNKYYAAGIRVNYNGVLYKVLQNHTSQASWTPDATHSLFTKVLKQDESTISEWEQPDSTNGYAAGDKVTHNGVTYESLVDNNVWEPGATGTETLWKVVTETE